MHSHEQLKEGDLAVFTAYGMAVPLVTALLHNAGHRFECAGCKCMPFIFYRLYAMIISLLLHIAVKNAWFA